MKELDHRAAAAKGVRKIPGAHGMPLSYVARRPRFRRFSPKAGLNRYNPLPVIHMTSHLLPLAIALLLALPLGACRQPPPDIETALQRGLGYLASSYDGNDFDDPYLRFVYPGESLASPLPGYRVTYRLLDGYFIVLLLREAGVDPGPARTLFERAEALTAALVPEWRRAGIYNLRRDPAPAGIALDTYSILACLRRDPPMARVVLAGLDGDGWLAPNLYTGAESFRLLADESWAVRALAVTGVDPPRTAELAAALCAEARTRIAAAADPLARANLALHALAAARDVAGPPDPLPTGDPAGTRSTGEDPLGGPGGAGTAGRNAGHELAGDAAAAEASATDQPGAVATRETAAEDQAGAGFIRQAAASHEDCRSALVAEAIRLLDDPRLQRDTLTLANLVEALVPEKGLAAGTLEPAVAAILDRQQGDGGWSVSEGVKGPDGRVLCTLRCLLALARWREHRAPDAVGQAGAGTVVQG